MKVEVWSDVVCPWCYIGKRRLEAAIEQFDEPVEVTWRSFQLDPHAAPKLEGSLLESLAAKYRVSVTEAKAMMDRVVENGERAGLDFRFDEAKTGNTFNAHRLLHFAAEQGLGGELKEALLQAYFTDGEPIGDVAALQKIAESVGLTATEVADVLATDRYANDVRADVQAAREAGANGVPYFVFEGKYGVSGAQESETLVQVLEQVRSLREPEMPSGELCDDDGCALP